MEVEREQCVAEATVNTKNDGRSFENLFKTEFDAKYKIVDIQTPLNAFMSGQFKRSYAYYTLRNRLPVVLTQVIDSLTKDKNELVAQFGENAREELKIIIGLISRLKYELQTDKPFQTFTGDEPDRQMWNNFITHLPVETCSFFKACLMHAECYMYRKLYSFVENSIFLKKFDYFAKTKEDALTNSQEFILTLAKNTRRTEKTHTMFDELIKFSLWSNRNDLSASKEARMFNMNILDDVSVANEFLLVNESESIWLCLSNKGTKQQTVDFVLDNAGYELFTDLILAEYIIEKGLASKVRFHVKAFPYYVTDITKRDFDMMLKYLTEHPDYIISLLGQKFTTFLEEGKFELAHTSYFWTAPYAFRYMRVHDPYLYETLQKSKLILFKGDLNYRKLLADVCWEPTHDIRTCLGGFIPTNLCILRTIKAEVICGLDEGVSEDLCQIDANWMIRGNYAQIQYIDGSREFGY